MSSSFVSPVQKPPLLRGALIFVFLWLIAQFLLGSAALADVLFGVLSGAGYVTAIHEYGWEGVDWSLWPLILADFLRPVLHLVLYGWLLRRFLLRSPAFSRNFLLVIAASLAADGVVAIVSEIMLDEVPVATKGVGAVLSFGIYQYLVRSPRATSVFRAGDEVASPAVPAA